MILFDTNVVVWMMGGGERFGLEAQRTITAKEDRRCSAMVQWELAMLADKRRMSFVKPIADWIDEAKTIIRFTEVPVTGDIARDAGSLPGTIHGDPCDRIMIATARAIGCPLMTSDRKILDYAAQGHVQAIDARR